MKPSELLLGRLKEEHLIRVADVIRRARDSAARHAKRHLGDTLCSIGLVAYERACYALTLAAKDEYRDWLSVGFEDNHFVIKIMGIPLRFYPGDEDLPIPARSLKIGDKERQSITLAFEGFEAAAGLLCLRLEILKNEKGYTRGVRLIEVDLNGGRRGDSWPIPKYVAPKVKRRKGAVELPPIQLDDPKPQTGAGDSVA